MIDVGMWVVGGLYPGELDYGLVLTKSGSVLKVTWHGGDVTTGELAPGAETYQTEEAARVRYLERREALRRGQ